MTLLTLQIIWFLLVGIVMAGYAILGGYDMGTGSLYLFSRSNKERFQMLRSIGPYWGANQVWLVTFGGGLFAAFPFVFATVFSGFYLAMILVLFGLIIRTISIEFRYQLNTPIWNKVWNTCFGVGSILPSILFGVAIGNILRGIPLDTQTNYAGSFLGLLNPYAISMGLLSFTLFTWHGANYLLLVSDGSLRQTAGRWSRRSWVALSILIILLTAWTFIIYPHLTVNFKNLPLLYILPLAAFAGIVLFPVLSLKIPSYGPIMASVLTILGMVGTVGASLFPRVVPNLNTIGQFNPVFFGDYNQLHLQNSLTVFNASSSQFTLTVMFIVAAVGVPTVILYTIYAYKKLAKGELPISETYDNKSINSKKY